jgi:hypothetical protein
MKTLKFFHRPPNDSCRLRMKRRARGKANLEMRMESIRLEERGRSRGRVTDSSADGTTTLCFRSCHRSLRKSPSEERERETGGKREKRCGNNNTLLSMRASKLEEESVTDHPGGERRLEIRKGKRAEWRGKVCDVERRVIALCGTSRLASGWGEQSLLCGHNWIPWRSWTVPSCERNL